MHLIQYIDDKGNRAVGVTRDGGCADAADRCDRGDARARLTD